MSPCATHDDDAPLVLLPTRMERVMAEYLHLIVQLKRSGFIFSTLAQLQAAMVEHFLAQRPYPTDLPWRIPRRVPTEDTASPRAHRQVNFQIPQDMAHRIEQAAVQAGVTKAVFLYTATWFYLENVATPHTLELA